MTLYCFLCALAEKKLNDPKEDYWLPRLLDEMKKEDGSRALPLHIETFDMGELAGEAAQLFQRAFAQSWLSAVSVLARVGKIIFNPLDFVAIPDPNDPNPSLSFSDITIDGLSNTGISIQEEAEGDAYRTAAKLSLWYYGDRPGLSVCGNYRIRQTVCAADAANPTQPTKKVIVLPNIQWPSQELIGRGKFLMEIRDSAMKIELKTETAGEETSRRLVFDVQKLQSDGREPGSGPEFWLDESALTVETIISGSISDLWKKSVTEIFKSAQMQSMIKEMLDNQLEKSRPGVAKKLQNYLEQYLDKSLGGVTGELPYDKEHTCAGPVDRYLFDRLRYSVSNAEGTLYLPAMLKKLFPPEKPLELGRMDLGNVETGKLKLEQVYLEPARLEGMDSGTVRGETMYMDGDCLHMLLDFHQMTLTGCLFASALGEKLEGKICVSVSSPEFTLASQVSAEGTSFKMLFEEILLQASPDGITLHLEAESVLLDLINSILNSSEEIKKQVVQGINQGLSGNLEKISKDVTGYLQSFAADD